jgi:phage terminase small subunit
VYDYGMAKAKRKGPKGLNLKQRRFCQEYVIDYNATKAAQRAGYSEKTAYAQGSALLNKPEIQQKIAENIEKISNSTQISAEKVLNELAKLAFYNPQDFFNADGSLKDISDLTEDQAACINGLEVVDIPRRVAKLKKIKLSSKDSALDKLMRHLGLYKDRLEIDPGDDLVRILTKAEERVRGRT